MIKVYLKLLLMTFVFLLMNVVHLMPLLMTTGIICVITDKHSTFDVWPLAYFVPPVMSKVHNLILLLLTTGTL